MKRHLLNLILGLSILVGITTNGYGQTSLYFFSAFSSPYTSISAFGTPATISADDVSQLNIPIGFTFNYCGTNYTQLSACSNGFIKMSNTAPSPFTNIIGNISSAGWILPFWDDLHGAGHTAYYATTGTAPNRVFTFEWNNFHHFSSGAGGGNCNLQVKLYESSNVIDFCYGVFTLPFFGGTIGITNTAADVRTLPSFGAAPVPAMAFHSVNAWPAPNQVYRWSPCPATIVANNSGAVCPGEDVVLSGVAGGGAISFTWSGPGGFSASTLTATVSPAVAGVYTIVASNGTCTVSSTTTVTVNPAPPAFSITPSVVTMCGPAQLLTAPGAYVWTAAAGLYTDAGATTPYVAGTPATSVYAAPATTTVYTAIATVGSCTAAATATVNVSAAVLPITGVPTVCEGSTTALSSASPGGTWSSSTAAVGTVSPGGVVSGISAGTTTITYTVGLCFATQVVTVHPVPSAIGGIPPPICLGSTVTLTSTPAGGTWSSSAPAIVAIGASTGAATGSNVGTSTISYTLATGCASSVTATVNPNPGPIVGPASICVGATTTFTATPAGGFWTMAPPGAASINVLSGVSTGLSAGTTIVTYTQGGCRATHNLAVVTAPGPIVGATSLCNGTCITMTNGTPGGTWSTSNPAVATITSPGGLLCGLSNGTVTVTYSLSASCFTTLAVTVTAAPASPSGAPAVCVGATTTYTHPTPGGVWSAACPGIATVAAGTGVVTGVGAGTCNITYTLPSGCISFSTITVNPLPGAIVGTPTVCQGNTTALSSPTPGGTWSSSTPAVGTIDAGGLFTGLTSGTSTVTYTAGTGCYTTMVVTVTPAPSPVTGVMNVCAGSTTALTGTPGGGVWSIVPASPVATVSGTGVVTGLIPGTAIVTYTTPGGCFDTAIVTVLDTPTSITGSLSYCVGNTTTLSVTPAGGTWSSSAPGIAPVLTTGTSGSTSSAILGGNAAGPSTIVYTRANGCTRSTVVSVQPVPGTIGGTLTTCIGQCTNLTNASAGGIWTSSAPAVGTINAATGVFCGVSAGTSNVTYSLGSGCTSVTTVTVNPLPSVPVVSGGGSGAVCMGSSLTLTSAPTPGVWSSSTPAVGTVNTTGVVTGVGTGTTAISYTLVSTGCVNSRVVTVNGLPGAISGSSAVCVGQCTTLTDTPATGTWSSSNPSVGTINAITGQFCGIVQGTSTVSYILPTGCYRTMNMAVNPLPTGISPAAPQVCEGSCTPVTGTPGGGIWSSSTPAVGTIGASSGSFCGIAAGTTTLVYTMGSGCTLSVTATVHPLPAAITGTASVCVNSTTTLNSITAGGTWSVNPTTIATVNPATGEVTGVSNGTATVSYTTGTGCRVTRVVTVLALPAVISGSPSVCVGLTTTLTSTPGGTWSVLNGTLASISSGGVVTGLFSTGADTTSVLNTNANGCVRSTILTVYAPPTTITGTAATCVGSTTTLNSTPAGGTWSAAPASVATVNPTTGVVTGINGPLTATITYTLPSGCNTTQVVTVYALPSAITGPSAVCEGATVALGTTSPGGGWSSSDPAIATVDVSGNVTGTMGAVLPASVTITYTLGTGCFKTHTMTVNPIPTAITGTMEICQSYGTTTLTGTPSGGTWSSTTPATATVNTTTGVVSAAGAGIANIVYTLPVTGCQRSTAVTVNPLPAAFSGPGAVCVNETITLTSGPAGGVWSSPDATVNVSTSGDVTGMSAGTAVISYAAPVTGCVRTGTVTVNGLPAPIGGTLSVCEGLTTALTNASGGGTWSSSVPAVGTVDAGGVVTGITAGTTLISYTFVSTGCSISAEVTVNGLPSAILGPDGFCNFSDATYTSSPLGGTWSSSDPAIISFASPAVGIATGNSATGTGTATITYTTAAGCITTKNVFLIFAPYPIVGNNEVCLGDTTTLYDTIGGGSWTTTNPAIASVNPSSPTTAIVTGNSVGTADIYYTLSTGCSSVHHMTVNPLPDGVTGSLSVCEGLTTDLDNLTPGGVWSSYNPAVGTIDPATGIATGINGGVLGDTTTIMYALGTGCNAKVILTVNPLPAVITGVFAVCEHSVSPLTSGPAGGVWSISDPAVATINPVSGDMTGESAYAPGVGGMGRSTVTYTLGTGCIRIQDITVNPVPADISGVSGVCSGDITVLGNGTPGGTWVSSNTSIATIDPVTGVLTGGGPGTVVISYVLGTGCMKTWPMVVNDTPSAITGSLEVCAGFATNLTSGPAGGVWSQTPSSMVYGTINSITGVVSGITGGLVPVTYTLGSGCRTTQVVTVITLPPLISGPAQVCEAGGVITMIHPMTGGTWSIANPAIATVDASGNVTGHVAGTTVLTYTVGTGCFNIHTITVNPLPAAITGPTPMQVCEGSTITLSSATPSGVWVSDATDRATIGSTSGVLTGVNAGVAPIRYVIGATGCEVSALVTVNPTPAAIVGNPHICEGAPVAYMTASHGGTWSVSNPSVVTLAGITDSTVTGMPVSLGVATITYQYPMSIGGCLTTKSVTVQPLPVVYNVTGGGSMCAGDAGVPVGLDGSQPGVSYVLYRGATATGYLAGSGFALDFGPMTVSGVYTVQATNATSGCQRNMAGSATVIVNSPALPSVTIGASPADSVCPGEVVTLTPVPVHGGTAPAYVWRVNGVTVGVGGTYSFIPADGDVASVTLTSDEHCVLTATATGSKTLTVLPQAVPYAGVSISPNDTVCESTPVTLTAVPEYGGNAPAYEWYLNGSMVSTGVSYTYSPDDGDVLGYRLVSDYRCRLTDTVWSADVTLSVDELLLPHVTIYPEPGLSVTAGMPVTLIAVATDAGPSPLYQWKVNGYPVSGATSNTFTYIFNDYDSVTCMVTSSGVCHNIGTHDWVFITTTALSAGSTVTDVADLRLLPNPNRGRFTVRGSVGGKVSGEVPVDITNMLGQVVYRGSLHVSNGMVDAQVLMDGSLANGMYMLTLHLNEGKQTLHFVMEQ